MRKNKYMSLLVIVCLLSTVFMIFPINVEAEGTRDSSWYPYLRVSILYYQEDSEEYLDPLWGIGDPYFHIKLDEDANGTNDSEVWTDTFDDTATLSNPFYHDFILYGQMDTLKLTIFVYDNDIIDNDLLDYTPSSGGKAYIHTIDYDGLKTSSTTYGPYNGEDDGVSSELDCTISYKVELFNWNVGPIMDDIVIIGQSNYSISAFEPISLYSYVFDPNRDPLNYQWDFGNGETSTDEIGSIIYTESGSYSVSLRVDDPLTYSIKYVTIHVSGFPYTDYSSVVNIDRDDDSYSLDTTYSETLYPGISSEEYYIPWPFEMTFWVSLVVDVNIVHIGETTIDINRSWNDGYNIVNSLYSSYDSYTYSILPHFEVNYVENGASFNEVKTFDLPIPSTWEIYDGQPFFDLGGTRIYYWDRMVTVGTNVEYDSIGSLLYHDNSFQIASIDLVPYVDKLIDLMLPGWTTLVNIGRDFLNFIGLEPDRILNLNFNIDLTTIIHDQIWLHQKTSSDYVWNTITTPSSGVWSNDYLTSPISFSSSQKVNIDHNGMGQVADIYPCLQHISSVRVSGSIDLEYGYSWIFSSYQNTVRLFDSVDYGLYLEDQKTSLSTLNKKISVDPLPDFDTDGIPDDWDDDDDNDGVIDINDAFPFDSTEWEDSDGDGTGNNADADDDNDGTLDVYDDLPLDPSETVDTDKDGIGNNADTDDDGDGVSDAYDDFPLDPSETVDTDKDGIGNNADTDDDGDNVLDIKDKAPLDPTIGGAGILGYWWIFIIFGVVLVVIVIVFILRKKPPEQPKEVTPPPPPPETRIARAPTTSTRVG